MSFLPVLAVVAVIVAIFMYKGFMDSDSVKDDDKKKYVPDMDQRAKLKRTTISSKKDGVKLWELDAEEIAFDQISDKSVAVDVRCTFFDKSGRKSMLFESPTADIDMKTEKVVFPKPSRGMMTESGDILEAGRLVWDGGKKKVYGYEGVRIFRSDYVIRGDEMIGDPETKNVELIGHVSGAYLSEDPDAMRPFSKK